MKFCRLLLIVLISSTLVVSCSKDKKKTNAEPAATAVTVMPAKLQTVQIKFRSSGSLTPITNPTIKAEVNSHLLSVDAYTGEQIKADQILARLDDSKQRIAYQQAKAKVASEQAVLNERKIAAESNKELLQKGVVSKLTYAKAEAQTKVAEAKLAEAQQELLSTENQLERTLIRSPISGHVEDVYVSKGESVTIGTKMFKLINHNILQARLPFSQERASSFQVGQEVHLLSPATPGKEYVGQVTAIMPSINPDNRSIDVIVAFESDNLWHAGASIEGHVFLAEEEQAFVVPTEAVVLRQNGTFIYTVDKNNKAVQHTANIINESYGNAAVSANIKNGDKVVIVGAQYLSNGALVKITNPAKKTTPEQSTAKKATTAKNSDSKTTKKS